MKSQIKSLEWSFPMPDEGSFICIDKPKGPTSHQVDYWVRQITGIERVGHIGTLDPQATGLLVVALGKCVRLVDIAHEYPKEYVATLKLHADSDETSIRNAFEHFKGEVFQLPPIKSAVARRLRSREIYGMEIMEIRNRDVLFKVKCQSGTYIRTLCVDIGYYLGTKGNMTDLRRIGTGPFREGMAITLQDLSDRVQMAKNGKDHMLKAATYQANFLLSATSKIVIKMSSLKTISHGSDLYPGGIKAIIGEPLAGERVALVSEAGQLVGTGKMVLSYNQISDTKIVDLDRVLIDPEPSEKPKIKATVNGKEVHLNVQGANPPKDKKFLKERPVHNDRNLGKKPKYSGNREDRNRPERREHPRDNFRDSRSKNKNRKKVRNDRKR